MKVLIVLLACLASCLADDSACLGQAKTFVDCMVENVTAQAQADMEELKGLGQEIFQCFGGKDNKCKLQRPQGPPPPGDISPKFEGNPFAQIENEARACFQSAGTKFQACATDKGVALPPMPAPGSQPGQGLAGGRPGMPPPPSPGSVMHNQFFPDGKIDFQQINALALRLCQDDGPSARALMQCAISAVIRGKHLRAVARFIEPRLSVCVAAGKCQVDHPISNECVTKFQGDRAALCACKTEAEAFFKQDAQCASTRNAIEQLKQSADSNAVNQARLLPQHPQFDICGVHDNPQVQCAELEKKVDGATKMINDMTERLAKAAEAKNGAPVQRRPQ